MSNTTDVSAAPPLSEGAEDASLLFLRSISMVVYKRTVMCWQGVDKKL